jgi:hypothetical protein
MREELARDVAEITVLELPAAVTNDGRVDRYVVQRHEEGTEQTLTVG